MKLIKKRTAAKRDPAVEKELRWLRKRSAVIRLAINAIIAVCCALDYVGERSAFLNVVHGGGLIDFILTIVLLDTLFVFGWLAGEWLMKVHFGLLVIALVVLFMPILSSMFVVFIILWLIISLIVLLPFIICHVSSDRLLKSYEQYKEDY